MPPSALGKRVGAMRKERGWSRYELANKSGLNIPRLSDIEDGDTENPRLDTMKKLSQAFGVSLDFLVNGRDPRSAGPKKDDVVMLPVMAAQDPPAREPVVEEETHALPATEYKEGRRLVRVYGKSMWPKLYPGDLVLMDANEKVKLGDMAVLRWGTRMLIAILRAGNSSSYSLEFANPTWPPVEPGEGAKVLGKVVRVVEGNRPFGHHD